MQPLVSIVIPHKDRPKLLIETLISVQKQSFKNWEVIIIDDYSLEETIDFIQKEISKEKRIRLHKKSIEDKGAAVSRNIGLKMAKGNFLLFLDSDDLLEPFALEQRIRVLTPDINVVFAPTFEVEMGDFNSKKIWNGDNSNNEIPLILFLRQKGPWHTMSGLWQKNYIQRIGGWDEQLESFQDWELHIRAILNGVNFKQLSTPDNYYRLNSAPNSIAKNFWAPHVINGRFKAFVKVYTELKKRNLKKEILLLRFQVIRNLILLIDNNKVEEAKDLLKLKTKMVLSWGDRILLLSICRHNSTWRYSKKTMIPISFIWGEKKNYDPWHV